MRATFGLYGVWVSDETIGLRGAWCRSHGQDWTGSSGDAERFATIGRAKFPTATYEVRPYVLADEKRTV
jgi:hypothetical protein